MHSDPTHRGSHRRTMLAMLAGVLIAGPGCALFLKHASPEELGMLGEDRRARLATFEDERLRIATAWQFAKREREIAQAEYDATRAKRSVADDLSDWASDRASAAQRRMSQDQETLLRYCQGYYTALMNVHKSEKQKTQLILEAAEAFEDEQEARYDLAAAEQERARMAAVTDRPGVLKEDRDKILGRWNDQVEGLKLGVTESQIDRRQAEIRASDGSKAFAGEVSKFRKRFGEPCEVNWALPEPGQELLAPPLRDPEPRTAPTVAPKPTMQPPAGGGHKIEIPRTTPSEPAPVQFGKASTSGTETGTAAGATDEAPMMVSPETEASPLEETD